MDEYDPDGTSLLLEVRFVGLHPLVAHHAHKQVWNHIASDTTISNLRRMDTGNEAGNNDEGDEEFPPARGSPHPRAGLEPL